MDNNDDVDDDAFFNLDHGEFGELLLVFDDLPDAKIKKKKKLKKSKKKTIGVKMEKHLINNANLDFQISLQLPKKTFKSSLISDFEKLEQETLQKSHGEAINLEVNHQVHERVDDKVHDEILDPQSSGFTRKTLRLRRSDLPESTLLETAAIDLGFGDLGRIEQKLSRSMQERITTATAVSSIAEPTDLENNSKATSVDSQTFLLNDEHISTNNDISPIINSKYIFKIVSKLPGTENLVVDGIVMQGTNKRFREVSLAAIKYLAINNFIQPEFRDYYHPDAAILMYKSKIKIQHYMKPLFLDLPKPKYENEAIFVNLTLETKQNADKQSLEAFQSVMSNDLEPDESSDTDDDIIYQDANSINKSAYHVTLKNSESEIKEEKGLISIKLKDKDGASFELKVKQSTLIKNIISYYVRKKSLTSEKGVCVLFDAESLNPDITVEDAELEDEDVLDVVY